MDKSWFYSNEALEHFPDCTMKNAPTNVCHCLDNRLMNMINDRDAVLKKANIFVNDVMPQLGGLVIQDFTNLNELCIGLTKLVEKSK